MHKHIDLSFYAVIRGKRTYTMNDFDQRVCNDNVAYCLSFALRTPRRIIILSTCHMQVSFLQREKAAAKNDGK